MYELKITRNYALALFNNSVAMSLEEKVLKQISAISDIFSSDKKLSYIMCSPVVPNSDKDKILAALIEATKIDRLVERFLSLLVRKARFNLLGSITEAYSLFFSESRGIKYAEVISSSKLGAEEVAKVQKYLEQSLEKIIKIKSTVDHDLIGGVIVKYDSNLIDCSVSGALERVEKVAKGAQV